MAAGIRCALRGKITPGVKGVKEKEKKGFIIPYGWNVGANLLGNPASQVTGLPLFLKEEADVDPDKL